MFILSFLFFLTAILYSSVGFGGGSTYLSLLLIWDVPYQIFPIIALCCNIIVVSGNCFNYARAGNINIKLLIPYLISSIPLAFIGGSLQLDKDFFEILLFIVLSLAGLSLLLKFKSFDDISDINRNIPKILSFIIGGSIGFVSGVVGIGGGIFLSPILMLIKAGRAKDIATTASIFILINSIAGIFGQSTKGFIFDEIYSYWHLFLSVLIGGQFGNFLNIKILPARVMVFLTALLVIFVATRMGFKLFI
ncbi:sulfite exporter TauE/SafE family protein [Candidatus Pelagibacter sp.]|nr:sulfite exporter TauE/SafE family protein [Candidatus Pelagibacter sp.]